MTSTDTRPEPRLTLLTAAQEGAAFTGKRFTLQDDHSIAKTAAGNIWRWHAEVRLTPSAEGLARGLSALRPDQAIALGAPAIEPDSPFLIGHGIRRTQEHFRHAEGRGWLLLDFDNGGMPAGVADRIREMGGVLPALERIWPELKGACRLVRFSSSAGVHRIGDPAPDLSDDVALGRHVFVLMRDQRQSKAALEALTLRAFAHGLGWIKLSASGGLLVRSIVDASVHGPERLVFCGPPELGEGVARTVPAVEWQEGAALDAPAPPPGSFAHSEIARLKADAAPEARQVQRTWSKRQVHRVMAQTGVTAREAIQAVRQRLDGGVLAENDLLQLRDGTHTTVAALLDQIEDTITEPGAGRVAYGLPCPAEGLEYGATSATIYWAEGFLHPVLISHAHGARTVYRFERYVSPTPKARPVALPALPDTQTARDALAEAVEAFMARAAGWVGKGANDGLLALEQPAQRPFECLAVHVGLGKTRGAIQAAADLVVRLNEDAARQAEAEGEDPHPEGRYAVVYAGPTHEFLEQVGRDFEALGMAGIEVAHLRGPQAVDPAGDGEQTMCRDADAYTLAQAFLQRPQRVCIGCQYREGCSYRANQRAVGTVYLVAHAELGLGRKAPPTLSFRGQTVAALIVDEDATGAMVFGAAGLDGGDADDGEEIEPGLVKLKDLLASPIEPEDLGDAPEDAGKTDLARQLAALQGFVPATVRAELGEDGVRRGASRPRLQRVREAIEAAAKISYEEQRATAGPKGRVYLELGALVAAMKARGLSPRDLFEAGAREWARRETSSAVRLTAAEYKAAVGANLTIRPAQRLYAALANALQAAGWDADPFEGAYAAHGVTVGGLCGRVRIMNSAKAGMVLRVSGLQALGEGFAAAPTLILDATAEPELMPLVWGQMPVITTIGAAEPRFDVAQDATRAGSKVQLVGHGSQTSLNAAKGWREKLARWIVQTAGGAAGGALVVGNLALVQQLAPLVEKLAPNAQIAWGHFNALRGMNNHQSRDAVIVIGRTRPRPEDIALTIEALTGAVVADKSNAIKKGPVERLALMSDGSYAMVEGTGVTGEPLAMALTRLIESAEVEQALGRLRAVNRQGEDLRAYVLGDAVLPRPVRLVNDLWSSVKMAGGVVGAQLDLGGDIAFLSAPHAFAAHGEKIGRNVRAVRAAFERDQIRRDLIAAVDGDPAEADLAASAPQISYNTIYENCGAHEPPFDPVAAGLDPRLYYLARYFAPKTRMASFVLVRAAAFGDKPLDLDDAKHRCAEMIRAQAGVEPRDLMLHSHWGPRPEADAPSAKKLITASPTGLLADLPPVKEPDTPARSWRSLSPGITARRVDGGVHVFNQMLAAALRLQKRGHHAA